jgi:hypothetical protein
VVEEANGIQRQGQGAVAAPLAGLHRPAPTCYQEPMQSSPPDGDKPKRDRATSTFRKKMADLISVFLGVTPEDPAVKRVLVFFDPEWQDHQGSFLGSVTNWTSSSFHVKSHVEDFLQKAVGTRFRLTDVADLLDTGSYSAMSMLIRLVSVAPVVRVEPFSLKGGTRVTNFTVDIPEAAFAWACQGLPTDQWAAFRTFFDPEVQRKDVHGLLTTIRWVRESLSGSQQPKYDLFKDLPHVPGRAVSMRELQSHCHGASATIIANLLDVRVPREFRIERVAPFSGGADNRMSIFIRREELHGHVDLATVSTEKAKEVLLAIDNKVPGLPMKEAPVLVQPEALQRIMAQLAKLEDRDREVWSQANKRALALEDDNKKLASLVETMKPAFLASIRKKEADAARRKRAKDAKVEATMTPDVKDPCCPDDPRFEDG